MAKKIAVAGHKKAQSEQRIKAAKLLFEDKLTDQQIADECGVTRRQLARWKQMPEVVVEVERLKERSAEAAGKSIEKKAFNTTDRLVELANLDPKTTNGTIGGQVKACAVIAQIRGEIVNRHEDLTPVTPEARKRRTLELLREGAQRIEKVN